MFPRNLYAIRDCKGGFADPCTQLNDAVAIRAFSSQVPRVAAQIGVPVKDFQLWRVGTYDTDSGMLTPDTPVMLFDAASIPVERSDNVDAESAFYDTDDL